MYEFALRFDGHEVRDLSRRFGDGDESHVERDLAARVRTAGVYSRDDFLAVCHWKSPRSQPLCRSNSEEFVRAVTAASLASTCEQFRVEALMLLRGVNWPTASALLHFGSTDPYPVLDWRAVWSAGIDGSPAYCFAFWLEYVRFCRTVARRHRVSMRVLDRALWQYSKETQG